MGPMARLIKRNVSLSLIILFVLFYVLPMESIAAPKNAEGTTQPVITQQNSNSNKQGSNNSEAVPGQEKVKDNKGQSIGNNGKKDNANNGSDNQGNNNQGSKDNGINNGNEAKNGNGNPSDGKETVGNGRNKSENNGLGEGVAAKTFSFFGAIGRGTNKVAGVLKSIPAKAVPTAVAAAQALGANLADKLEALAQYVKGMIGIVNTGAGPQGAGTILP